MDIFPFLNFYSQDDGIGLDPVDDYSLKTTNVYTFKNK